MEKVSFEGWNNCVKLTNGKAQLTVTTDIGLSFIRITSPGEDVSLLQMVKISTGDTMDTRDEEGRFSFVSWIIPDGEEAHSCPSSEETPVTILHSRHSTIRRQNNNGRRCRKLLAACRLLAQLLVAMGGVFAGLAVLIQAIRQIAL